MLTCVPSGRVLPRADASKINASLNIPSQALLPSVPKAMISPSYGVQAFESAGLDNAGGVASQVFLFVFVNDDHVDVVCDPMS